MKTALRHLWLLALLIATTSAILLFSDASHRQRAAKADQALPSIAIIQYASTPLIDEHVRGVIDELERQGCFEANRRNLRQMNAQCDNTMAGSIAREAVEGSYDLLITSSTMSLQSVANANQKKHKPHIFGGVTDPYGTGVGITGTKPGDHPPYLAGIGTFQPVTELFRIAKELAPGIQRVGVVWNPAEQCSAACLKKARAVCAELGIELVEVNVNNTSEVSEALRSLLSKNVEAVWIGGDSIATGAAKFIIKKAGESGVPVITNDPTDVGNGALIGLGADYYTVGRYTGAMAAEVIRGRSPATVAIENVVPRKLHVGRDLLDRLDGWRMTDSVQAQIAEEPKEPQAQAKAVRVAVISFVSAPGLDAAQKGLLDALREHADLQVLPFNAQGESSMVPQQIRAALAKQPDLVVTLSTPVMLAAAKQIRDFPVVFTVASNPADLGFGPGTFPENICGVYEDLSAVPLLAMVRSRIPGLRRIGTLYDPAQPNAVLAANALKDAARKAGVECIERTATAVAELDMATRSLVQQGAQAVVIGSDNLTSSGFPAIIKAARALDVPVFATEPELVEKGAAGAVGCDYYSWGFQAGEMAARVLAGASPKLQGIVPQNQKAHVEK